MNGDRFLYEGGTCVYTGNELLLKGCLEAGVSLIAGYPGSPVADLFTILANEVDVLRQYGVHAVQANNEAQAAAMLNGAQDARADAVAVMKSVGLHVASDALAIANYAGTSRHAGSIVIVGDDPALSSTQVGMDSRRLFQHLQMPVIAPSSFQEMKDWISLALDASRSSDFVMGYWVTTPQAEGGGTVAPKPNRRPRSNGLSPHAVDPSNIHLKRRVNIPPNSNANEIEILGPRREALHDFVRGSGLNRIEHEVEFSRIGFVSSGMAHIYLSEALGRLGLGSKVRILKLGLVYPIEPRIVQEFAQGLDHIFVVEEKGAFIESQVRDLMVNISHSSVWGKRFPNGGGFPESGGLTVGKVLESLIREKIITERVNQIALKREQNRARKGRTIGNIPARTPTFCPGCPHRETLSVLKETNRNLERLPAGSGPPSILFHGDIGCYSMAFLPPFHTMHNLSGMGLGGAAGAGADPFVTNPHVVLMGDSTFFHSGLLAISNSIQSNQNIIYILLDNKNTAMTGHQGTAASDVNLMGERVHPQEIERAVRGLDPDVPVYRVHPSDRFGYMKLMDDLVRRSGVQVVISDKECGITFHQKRRAREREEIARAGFLKTERHVRIVPEVCEFCLACTQATACPGLTFVETEYGTKVAIDRSTCVTDTYCTQVKACPSFETVTIRRSALPAVAEIKFREAPVPLKSFSFPWRLHASGIGGMGLGVLARVLSRAAEKDGFRVSFLEKKGLAIRNGSVEAHLTLDRETLDRSPNLPEGSADLLLGLDPLESARALPYARDRADAVVNAHRTLTVDHLIGEANYPEDLERTISGAVGRSHFIDFSTGAEEALGSKVFANMMIVGAAYQLGLLPLREAHLTEAIAELFSELTARKNLLAFQRGRTMVIERSATPRSAEVRRPVSPLSAVPLQELIERKTEAIRRSFLSPLRGRGEARSFQALAGFSLRSLVVPESDRRAFLIRLADLFVFGGEEAASPYARTILKIFEKDSVRRGYEATRAAIENLHRVLLIKDEVYVAHLLTSSEKYERDRETYRLGPKDRIQYVHMNRPRFTVFGRDFEFDVRARDWMLKIMKHARFLRRLLPQWHAREREFARWYQDEAVGGFLLDEFPDYESAVAALRAPEEVRGYREIRYEKIAPAMEKVVFLKRRMAAGM